MKWASLIAQWVKKLPAMQETQVQLLGQEDPLEKEMAIHSSILAWKILWTEEAGGLQSMGLQDQTWLSDQNTTTREIKCSFSGSVVKKDVFDPWLRKIPWRKAWKPTPVFLPGESHGQRNLAGYCVVHGVTKSWTWLKWFSMHVYNYILSLCSEYKFMTPEIFFLFASLLYCAC